MSPRRGDAEPDTDAPDRAAILARRALLVGSLSGLLSQTGCASRPHPCLSVPRAPTQEELLRLQQGEADASADAAAPTPPSATLPPRRPAASSLLAGEERTDAAALPPPPAPPTDGAVLVNGRRVYVVASACLTIGTLDRVGRELEGSEGANLVEGAEVAVLSLERFSSTADAGATGASLEGALRRSLANVRACYQRALRRDPDAGGTARVLLRSAGDAGTAVEVQGALPAEVLACLREALALLSLPGRAPFEAEVLVRFEVLP